MHTSHPGLMQVRCLSQGRLQVSAPSRPVWVIGDRSKRSVLGLTSTMFTTTGAGEPTLPKLKSGSSTIRMCQYTYGEWSRSISQ